MDEEPSSEAPQLPVETEIIRRKSSSVSEDKQIHVEMVLESIADKPGSSVSTEFHLDIQNETNLKRIDSDSKFGHMETVSLDLNAQEQALPSEPIKSSLDLSDDDLNSTPIQIRSISFNDDSFQSSKENSVLQRRHSAVESNKLPENSLSKYFKSNNASGIEPLDSKGLEFFNTLTSSTVQEEPATSDEGEKAPPDEARNIGTDEVKENMVLKSDLQETFTISELKESEEKPKETPSLQNFFAEDKSGTDRFGKAFFDIIAEVKNPITHTQKNSPQQDPLLLESQFGDEIEESWIPPEASRQTLVAMVTSAPGTFQPDKNQLTVPEIILEDEQCDPIKAVLIEMNSPLASQRKALTAADVSQDEDGLRKLIEAGCYYAAINLTKTLLRVCDQAHRSDGRIRHSPLSLRLWYTRLALLVKLKKYPLAEVESSAFGDLDRADLYYEFYPNLYNGKKGTMVPFSFRLLLAELPQYQGNHQVALDNLYRLLYIIQAMIRNLENGQAEDGSMLQLSNARRQSSLELWRQREIRIFYSILNCVLSLKDYILAVSVVDILLKKDKDHTSSLYSSLGRVYLQLGDVTCAQKNFELSASHPQAKPDDPIAKVEEITNKALLAIALNNNEDAYKYYQQAHTMSQNNLLLANNMAVSLLYMGRLKESLSLLERTIHEQPSACLHDGILFNTCTLYELESSRCTQKKLSMLDLVSKHAGDSFNVSCLKIQPNVKG